MFLFRRVVVVVDNMGKKARWTCAACGASFKQKGGADKGSRYCGATCATSAASAASADYGDIPPAFAGADGGTTRGGGGGAARGYGGDGGYGSDYSASSFSWERETGGGGGGGGGGGNNKKKGNKKRKRKKVKKQASSPQRPVESDPQCLAVMKILDDRCEVIASPGPRLNDAVAKCASHDIIAVDCEGTCMSRVGLVTLLQVAAGEDIFLFDVQALGGELFKAGGGVGAGDVSDGDGDGGDGRGGGRRRRRSLRGILEDPAVTKLMFDCRVDSDALFHQHDVRLEGVYDVQLADVAARRRNSQVVGLLSGMPKCAARHLPRGDSAAEASLATLDGRRSTATAVCGTSGSGSGSRPSSSPPPPPPDADAVSRVTEHLKKKVKEMYAPDQGGDGQLWALRPLADDVRRYAALDVWLLRQIHAAMTNSCALDDDWTEKVWRASKARTGEYRDLKEPVLQFRDPERAQAPNM